MCVALGWASTALAADTHVRASAVAVDSLFGVGNLSLERVQAPSDAWRIGGQLTFDLSAGGIADRGSSLFARWRPSTWSDAEGISATLYPLSGSRLRLGYEYAMAWGAGFFGRQFGGGQGLIARLERERWYTFAGAKTARILNPIVKEPETSFGWLAGGGVEVGEIGLELEGGWFPRGLIPGLANQNIERRVVARGVSARARWQHGCEINHLIEEFLGAPEVYDAFAAVEEYPDLVCALVSVEAAYLSQSLENPDQFAAVAEQPASAVMLRGAMKANGWRTQVIGRLRTVSFRYFETPGFPSYTNFPDSSVVEPQLEAAAAIDHRFLGLTPGLYLSAERPGWIRLPDAFLPGGGNNPPTGFIAGRSVVVTDTVYVLPVGAPVLPRYRVSATLRWDPFDALAAHLGVDWTYDPNRTTFRDDVTGVGQPSFDEPQQWHWNLLLQARL